MYFSACCGSPGDVERWRHEVVCHASRLDLRCRFTSRELLEGRAFSYAHMYGDEEACLGQDPDHGPSGSLLITTSSAPAAFDGSSRDLVHRLEEHARKSAINDIVLLVSLHTGAAEVFVPPASPERLYYSGGARAYVLSNDFRLMVHLRGNSLDESGVFALFQYLAVPPPLTLFSDIRCMPAGHVLKISPEEDRITHRVYFRPAETQYDSPGLTRAEMYVDEVGDHVLELIDEALDAAARPTVLLFSGGVDSSLLLTRLVETRVDDFHVVNFSFGCQDPEAELASEVADYLGLECEQITYDAVDAIQVLNRVYRDYSHPFGDLSVVPTNLLIHGVLDSCAGARSVVEGTAADGLFAVGAKYAGWQRIYRLPVMARRIASDVYDRCKLWNSQGQPEYVGRLLKRSVQLPLHQAAIMAQNALDGIAYKTPDHVRERLDSVISETLLTLAQGLPGEAQLELVDVAHICAGQFATKSFDPLCSHGIRPVFPFLSPAMVDYGLKIPGDIKRVGGEPKGLLKRLLARQLPLEFIYRPKSGFLPPSGELLLNPSIQEYLREIVLSPGNQLLPFLHSDVLEEMVDLARHRVPLSIGVFNFLWLLIFTSAWLEQVA